MRLYHGSPYSMDKLEPKEASGESEFENLKAVFLTDEFVIAALYAVSKHLKGETSFGVGNGKLVVKGDYELSNGFVYEFDISKDEVIEGERENQFAVKSELTPDEVVEVNPSDYSDRVYRVDSDDEIMEVLTE